MRQGQHMMKAQHVVKARCVIKARRVMKATRDGGADRRAWRSANEKKDKEKEKMNQYAPHVHEQKKGAVVHPRIC